MIIDSKVSMYPPPPPYAPSTTSPRSSTDRALTLDTLPSHILLEIVYSTFPQRDSLGEGKIERQRKTLLWLASALRLVNRSLYIACMHVLRSAYLPAYHSLIRPPYTSDPFPTVSDLAYTHSATSSKSHPIQSLQRETIVLDRFIALKVREDVFIDDSELHLEREDMFKDIFDHAQPKARLEDLVRKYGVREGVISLPSAAQPTGAGSVRTRGRSGSTKPSPTGSTSSLDNPPVSLLSTPSGSSSPQPRNTAAKFFGMFSKPWSGPSTPKAQPKRPPQTKISPVPFSRVTISLSPRTIGLVVGSGNNRRSLVQVQRGGRDESLEVGAQRIVSELKSFLLSE